MGTPKAIPSKGTISETSYCRSEIDQNNKTNLTEIKMITKEHSEQCVQINYVTQLKWTNY